MADPNGQTSKRVKFEFIRERLAPSTKDGKNILVPDRILTRIDAPCDRCGESPIDEIYQVIGPWEGDTDPTHPIEDGINIVKIRDFACLFHKQWCLNRNCEIDSSRHPLEKLARQFDDEGTDDYGRRHKSI